MRGFVGVLLFMLFLFAFSAQTMAAEGSNARFSFYLGGYVPSGSYEESGLPEFKYETGATGGVDFTYYFVENLGIGTYLDFNSFSSEEKRVSGVDLKLSASSTIFGVSLNGRINAADNFWLYAALRLGVASNSLEMEGSSGYYTATAETSGSTFAFSVQGGAIFQINKWDFGLILRYTSIDQEIEGGDSTDFGGISVLASVGYNF